MLPGILRLPEVFCVLGFSSRHTIASDLAKSNTPFQKNIFLGKHSHIIPFLVYIFPFRNFQFLLYFFQFYK